MGPERSDFRLERANLGSCGAFFRSEKADFGPMRADFRPDRANLGLRGVILGLMEPDRA